MFSSPANKAWAYARKSSEAGPLVVASDASRAALTCVTTIGSPRASAPAVCGINRDTPPRSMRADTAMVRGIEVETIQPTFTYSPYKTGPSWVTRGSDREGGEYGTGLAVPRTPDAHPDTARSYDTCNRGGNRHAIGTARGGVARNLH